jgi:carboxyl-terminal processing protease
MKGIMKRRFSIGTVGILVAVAVMLGMQLNSVISGDNIFEQLNKFKDVLSLTEKYYVDDVDTQKLVESAINGMLSTLDPHSVYIPASQLQKVTEDFQGSFDGIGVEFDVIHDTIIVVTPVAGGPSEALGILAGDKIVKINDTSCIGIKRDDVPKKLRGPKGTHVRVSIFRPGEKSILEFDITRDKIPLYSLDVSYMVNDNVGYISLNRFSATTHDEFVSALTKLRDQGMTRLILDLRNNGGGYLEQAEKVVDELLPKGKKIVYTKGRRTEFNEDYTSHGGQFTNVSLIVLVNHGSASASEIVSGAIQDWDRGLIVGETTFGKGLVQRQIELPDSSAFRLTIARYYTPSGRLIQRPYGKDLEEYEKEAFDKNETEGENIEHNEEKDTTRPVFKTSGGRKVFGGGGITPDYIIKSDRLTQYTIELLGKNVFQEYSVDYFEANGKHLRQDYEKELKKFLTQYTIDDEMMKSFLALAKKKSVTMNDEQFKKDLSYIKARIKAQIARSIWGNEGWFNVMRSEDNQFQKALVLFPEAEKIAGLH